MKKIKITKKTIPLIMIVILSSILNFVNLSIEGTANSYYAAAVKSMTLNLKNFFFVSFDPTGFVSIDKPPLGFWFQAISAKIFGFSGWSIILPQAIAGLISVIIIYFIVKRSFGYLAGLISALCLAITPTFVAASRNNTVDNVLVLFLLLACWALSIAAEKGKLKYLVLSMILVGLGFNVKMLQAYMVVPALYITYLFSSATSLKKRILHLVIGTVILLCVSLSWAVIVDLIPASSRPYVDSSTNNTVMELIIGHNGLERLGLSSSNGSSGAPGGNGKMKPPSNAQNKNDNKFPGNPPSNNGQMKGNPPSMPSGSKKMQGPNGGGPNRGNSSSLQGSFGGQTTASITRLFSKNILSDQIVWFIPFAILGFIASAIKEKLKFSLDNKKKQSLILWFMWFLPCFIYFSYTTGTFHPYYLTMLAPPIAALTGIGIVSMWELYKNGGLKSWFLPIALLTNGAVQLLMLYYFINSSNIVKILIVLLVVLCFVFSIILIILNILKNKNLKLKKIILSLALSGLLVIPFVGSSTVLFYKLNSSFPSAGLELLSSNETGIGKMNFSFSGAKNMETPDSRNSSNSKLISFLKKNKTKNQKYLLVVTSSNSGTDIILNTNESVMCLGGFLGNNKPLTLSQFKALVKRGEIRYVMTGGQGGNSNSEIINWVEKNGTLVSSSKYSNSQNNTSLKNNDSNMPKGNLGGGNSEQLYDLKNYTDSNLTK